MKATWNRKQQASWVNNLFDPVCLLLIVFVLSSLDFRREMRCENLGQGRRGADSVKRFRNLPRQHRRWLVIYYCFMHKNFPIILLILAKKKTRQSVRDEHPFSWINSRSLWRHQRRFKNKVRETFPRAQLSRFSPSNGKMCVKSGFTFNTGTEVSNLNESLFSRSSAVNLFTRVERAVVGARSHSPGSRV